MESLQNKINQLPNQPGVYIYKNDKKQIIYIGKAVNLKKRVPNILSVMMPLGQKLYSSFLKLLTWIIE
jgi:excinuclease UvrABC nuclease subunit